MTKENNTFFGELYKYTEFADLSMTISRKGEKITVMTKMKPKDGKTELPALMITGTPDELEKSFFSVLTPALDETVDIVTNIDDYREKLKETAGKEEPKKRITKATKKAETPAPAQTTSPINFEEKPVQPEPETESLSEMASDIIPEKTEEENIPDNVQEETKQEEEDEW